MREKPPLREKRREEKRRDTQVSVPVWPLAQKRNAGRPESSTIGPYRCIRERLPKLVLQKHRRTDVRVASNQESWNALLIEFTYVEDIGVS
jgi:hypothetical protein